MDGYLKIKTKIDNDTVDKDIAELENKIKKLQEDNANQSIKQSELQNEIDKYEELVQKADSYKERIKELEQQKKSLFVNGGLPANQLQSYERIINEIELANNEYRKSNTEIDKQFQKTEKVRDKLNQIKAKQTENNAKITEYKQKIEQTNMSKIQLGLNNVGQNIQKQIGSLGKMAMAVIGIRTAWGAVRSAISTVSQYNDQVSTDFEYMRYCIASMLVPAVQWLINLLYTVLGYINAIMQGWFGINLFSNASVKNFQKMKNSASGTAKVVKEIQKSLQGFDEMNVLQDNSGSNTGSSGAGGVGVAPSVDLSGLQGNIPQWLKWIIDNKDTILTLLAGVLGFITAIKLGLGGIKALGIGILVAGVVKLIQGIIAYIKNPSWYNFLTILQGIALIVAGIAILMGGWVVALIAVGVAIVTYLIQNWDKVKEILGIVGEWIYSHVIKPVGDFFSNLWKSIKDWAINAWNGIKNAFSAIGSWFYNSIIFPVGTFFSNLWNNFKNGAIDGWNGIKNAFSAIGNWIYGNIIQPVDNFFSNMWTNLKNGAINAWNGIKDTFNTVANFFKDIFSNAWQAVKNVFSTGGKIFDGIKEGIVTSFKNIVNAIIRGINKVIANPFNAINNVLSRITGIEIFGAKPFGFIHTISIPQIPQLARGGIITQPTQAIIGEAGKEAVVPLENNMEWLDMLADKLASKIDAGGAYVIQIDSRIMQRGIARREKQLAFATNGR